MGEKCDTISIRKLYAFFSSPLLYTKKLFSVKRGEEVFLYTKFKFLLQTCEHQEQKEQ